MGTVTKKDLIQNIAEKKGLNPLEVKDIVQAVLDEIIDQLGQQNRIEFRDFAVFDIRVRPARIGHNPRTLEKVNVPARAVVEFKMGKRMRDAVAGVDSQEKDAEAPTGAPSQPPLQPVQPAPPPPAAEAPPPPSEPPPAFPPPAGPTGI